MTDSMSETGQMSSRLMSPLDLDSYTLLRKGVQDDPKISVYINEQRDFAFLDPMPITDYASYERRSAKLGLKSYAGDLRDLDARLEKVRGLIPPGGRVLEIGASDGAFLERAHAVSSDCAFCAIEPDQSTRLARDQLAWLTQHDSVSDAMGNGAQFDLVMMFHVFEHILEPAEFLAEAHDLLAPGGALLIEVPCLHDPLLTLYESNAYQGFYFQRQHPYIYSATSLERVLNHGGFVIRKVIPHQRYGLENHLQWLSQGRPGGNEKFRDLFAGSDAAYRGALESAGTTDTVIVEAVAS